MRRLLRAVRVSRLGIGLDWDGCGPCFPLRVRACVFRLAHGPLRRAALRVGGQAGVLSGADEPARGVVDRACTHVLVGHQLQLLAVRNIWIVGDGGYARGNAGNGVQAEPLYVLLRSALFEPAFVCGPLGLDLLGPGIASGSVLRSCSSSLPESRRPAFSLA